MAGFKPLLRLGERNSIRPEVHPACVAKHAVCTGESTWRMIYIFAGATLEQY